MIKSWLITASGPFCGTDIYYCAFSDGDPTDKEDFPFSEITNELWDAYGYLLHLEDEEYDSEDEFDIACDNAYDEWCEECNIIAEEMSLKDLQDYIPGGPLSKDDLPEIIYDERK